jgi:hypothetical protein
MINHTKNKHITQLINLTLIVIRFKNTKLQETKYYLWDTASVHGKLKTKEILCMYILY